MKVKTVAAKKQKEVYPKLVKSTNDGIIVMQLGPSDGSDFEGVVVDGRTSRFGEYTGVYRDNWASYSFEDFDGSVTLSN